MYSIILSFISLREKPNFVTVFSHQPNTNKIKETKKEEAKPGSEMVDPIPAQVQPRFVRDFFSYSLDSHPLWFKPSLFLSPNFDSKSYISKLRTFVPFDTLQSELESHHVALNHELIDLINCDYANFINLNTKLIDIDASVVRMLVFFFFFLCGCFYYYYFNELFVLF